MRRLHAAGADRAVGPALLAMVGVGADEHPPAGIVEQHLVEIDPFRAAERARLVEGLDRNGWSSKSRLLTRVCGGTA